MESSHTKRRFREQVCSASLQIFIPWAGAPQLLPQTLFVPGRSVASKPVAFASDLTSKDTTNMHVEVTSDPRQPTAGTITIPSFRVGPLDGFEQYLGTRAHMLATSDDVVDMIHTHPTFADGGPELQFELIVPRERSYRIWVQFQRKGIVNTAKFDVAVESARALEHAIAFDGLAER